MMTKSPEDIADERVRMEERVLTPAQEPANTRRPMQVGISNPISEYPFRIIPHIHVFLGAVCNTVNDVVEEVKELEIDGSDKTTNLFLPLSRNKNGIAVEAFDSTFRFVESLSNQNYVLLAADEAVAKDRIESFVASVREKLSTSFEGDVLEQPNMQFSIDRADMFKTDIELVYARNEAVDAQTVNEVHVNVSIYIHVADLTGIDSAEKFNKRYKAFVRNAANATEVDTSLYVAFDVSNFLLRPTTLALFNSLLIDETVNVLSVEAVNGVRKHLPDEANIIVGVALTK